MHVLSVYTICSLPLYNDDLYVLFNWMNSIVHKDPYNFIKLMIREGEDNSRFNEGNVGKGMLLSMIYYCLSLISLPENRIKMIS